jgi:DNA-binding transcriptional MerR regulator
MENDNTIMSPGDVATLLGLKESTLRKYALILKDAGYHFQVNGKGQRWYYNRDVIAFKKLIEIKHNPDMTLEQSAKAVVSHFGQSDMSQPITTENQIAERYDDDMKELKDVVNQQNVLLQELMKKMDQQQKYIDEKLEQRDRKMMESIRESQEVKQQLLQIAAAKEEEKKKGFFARLFSK